MRVTDYDTRRNKVLEAIVEAYITSAQPVGSALISRRFRPVLSPATIRNVMSELEEAGLLEQPHTSAGRIPTARGFRYYVDSIMETPMLLPEEVRQIHSLVEPEDAELDHLMDRVSTVLSELAQQAAFVVAPTVKQSTVKQIELVPMGVHRLLCVLIANEEMVASHIVEIDEPLSRDEALALSRFVNNELVGLPFRELLDALERRLLTERDSFYYLVKRSLAVLQHALATEPEGRLLFEGTSYVVAQPEFSRYPHKAHALLKCLESQREFIESLQEDVGVGGVQVRIGTEQALSGLDGCSTVAAPFSVGGDIVGKIGVLGPVRMDYRRMAALVDEIANATTNILTSWADE